MNTKALVAALFAGVISASVFAQTTTAPAPVPAKASTPVIDQRAINQEKRIETGKASGQLTAKEAANLEKRDAKLNKDIAAAKADGKVTKAERAKLIKEENRNSKKIYQKKHNAKTEAPAAK